ncbi:MAG: hypothetical protein ACRETK_09990 [Steroidobacteraceae bacterium]
MNNVAAEPAALPDGAWPDRREVIHDGCGRNIPVPHAPAKPHPVALRPPLKDVVHSARRRVALDGIGVRYEMERDGTGAPQCAPIASEPPN